ncbi:MAG: hypothetical protein JKY51_01815 [Opitutaceae bacterium]|nr:hypothetical protein [Opitutaceae bacterium]
MNTRTIIIGIGVASSLVGLSFLAHYVYGGEQEDQLDEHPVKEVEKIAHTNSNHTQQKKVVKRHTEKPQVRKRGIVKPEPKVELEEVKELAPPVADEFPLRLGSEGKRVVRLQVWLMRNYGWTGKVTGVFDEKTESLLKKAIKEVELDEATYYEMKMEKPVHEQITMR